MKRCFAIISDTHLGSTKDYSYQGFTPYPRAIRAAQFLSSFPEPLDFVLHAGDVAGDKFEHCCPESAALASEVLGELGVPLYWVAGNHDDIPSLLEVLPLPSDSQVHLQTADELSYSIFMDGLEVLALHTSVPHKTLGRVSPAQMEVLQSRLADTAKMPLVLLQHHPILPVNSIWMDKNMLLAEGQELHERLLASERKVLGSFCGHVHKNIQFLADGILHCCVAATLCEFDHERSIEEGKILESSEPAVTIVRYDTTGLQVSTHFTPQGE